MKPNEYPRSEANAGGRRSLLKVGLAVALLPLLPVFPARAAGRADGPRPTTAMHLGRFDAVVYDVRHSRARAYGRALRGRAKAVHAMNGDPTTLWLELLDPLWRDSSARVAGMTNASALFCIEQMAHSHGMRVLERSTPAGNQELVAWVIGPARQQEV